MSEAATEVPSKFQQAVQVLTDFVAVLRPRSPVDTVTAEACIYAEATALQQDAPRAQRIGNALWGLLAINNQASLYAESGVRSALGFMPELTFRISTRFLPFTPVEGQLRYALGHIFHAPGDQDWVAAVSDEAWLTLFSALPVPPEEQRMDALLPVIEAIRVLSYRLAGTALDRELLRAEPALEEFESPFLAQNAELLPLLGRERSEGHTVFERDFDQLKVLLDQCFEVLWRVRRRALVRGISIRLTYLLARLEQLTQRLVLLLDFLSADVRSVPGVTLFKDAG